MPRLEAGKTRAHREPRRILAISPGGRVTGIAAIDGPAELRRFETIGTRAAQTARGKTRAFEARLLRMLREERPGLILIEAVEARRRTPFTDALAAATQRVARESGTPHALLPLSDARALLARASPTRVAVHRALSARFPQIAGCTRQPALSRWYGYTDQYWERSFAALALAVAWAESHARVPADSDSTLVASRLAQAAN